MTGPDPHPGVEPPPPEDAALLDELADALAGDEAPPDHGDPPAVPAALAAAARAAYVWRGVDEELAELLEADDGAVAGPSAAGVRSGGAAGLTFAAGARRLEVELHGTGPAATAMGQLTPPPGGPGATVRWETLDHASASAPIAPDGMFELPRPPRGPWRLVVTSGPGPVLRTDWVTG